MSFYYERPQNLVEVLSLIAGYAKENVPFRLSSGGTDVLPLLKQHDTPDLTLVSLSSVQELLGVREEQKSKTLHIGARTTLANLASNALIQKLAPCLADTAAKVASPQIRNRATVGGNLLVNHRCVYFNQSEQNRLTHLACFKAGGDVCHLVPNARRDKLPVCRARFVSDLAALLMVMNARIELRSQAGTRTMKLQEFYVPDGIDRNRMRREEILASVEVDLPVSQRFHYEKLRIRNAIDFPSLGVAVGVDFRNSSMELRVAVIGVNMQPIFLQLAEKDFPGREALLDAACAEATKAAVPLKQDFFPPTYRRKMISVLIRRSFQKLEGGPS